MTPMRFKRRWIVPGMMKTGRDVVSRTFASRFQSLTNGCVIAHRWCVRAAMSTSNACVASAHLPVSVLKQQPTGAERVPSGTISSTSCGDNLYRTRLRNQLRNLFGCQRVRARQF